MPFKLKRRMQGKVIVRRRTSIGPDKRESLAEAIRNQCTVIAFFSIVIPSVVAKVSNQMGSFLKKRRSEEENTIKISR